MSMENWRQIRNRASKTYPEIKCKRCMNVCMCVCVYVETHKQYRPTFNDVGTYTHFLVVHITSSTNLVLGIFHLLSFSLLLSSSRAVLKRAVGIRINIVVHVVWFILYICV